MAAKHRKVLLAITLGYTGFILYLMFFAFGRADTLDRGTGYTFEWIPEDVFKLPGLSDLLHPTLMDAVGVGNVAAFVPFGLLIPLLFRTGFLRFMLLFLLSILVLETVQALTMLGSFDMNDVIHNSIGAAVGFGAYRFGFRGHKAGRNLAATGVSALVLLIGIWAVFGLVDQAFKKELGPFVAINELKSDGVHSSAGIKQDRFLIGGQTVEPAYNAYSTEGQQTVTYTYAVGPRELYFYLNYGIPDQEEAHGSLRISVDGQEYLSSSGEDPGHEPAMASVYLQGADELTITLEGNLKMWDVGFREMRYAWNK